MARSKHQKRKEKKKRERQHRVRKAARMKRDAARTNKAKRERATQRMMQRTEKDDLVQQLLENYQQKAREDATAKNRVVEMSDANAQSHAIQLIGFDEVGDHENEDTEQRESEEKSE